MTTAFTNNAGTTGNTSTSKGTASANEASDRFLKLLVTQMQNQDPLNPLDNAQVTSQMAQINTVTGIDKLNTSVMAMNANLTQMQMLQGANMVGRVVLLEGDQLSFDSTTGKAAGGYELASAATKVEIEVVNAAGTVVDTITQTGKAAGRQGFEWTAPEGVSGDGLSFRVTATSNGQAVKATPVMFDLVNAINTTGGNLVLELALSGSTPYNNVKAVS